MKYFAWILIGSVAGLAGVLLLLPEPAPEPPDAPSTADRTFITGARIFDGEEFIDDATLVIAGGRIEALGRDLAVDDGAAAVDASGKTILPGLIDAHVHSFGTARADALRFGVTTMLDMFRPPLDFERTHAERESLAPTDQADLYSAGFLATAPGGHGTQYGIEVPALTGPDEAPQWVAARKAEGSDWIKIVIEPGWGGRELPTLDPATVAALLEAAHAAGLMAVAHVSTYADAITAIEAGVDGLMHLFTDRPVDAAFLTAARAAGIFVVPTTPVLAGLHRHDDTAWMDAHPILGPRLTTAQRQGLAQRFPIAAGDGSAWSVIETNIDALHAAGIPILAGSDAPNPGAAHGASIHHALRLLVGAGLSPTQALRAATGAPAGEFGLEDRGCLKSGCRADLLIVDGNPQVDIAATAQIDSIWKNGHRVEVKPPAAPVEPAAADETPTGPVDLLADCESWTASADNYMGGASESAITWTDDGDAPALELSARVAAGYAFPYAGAMWFADAIPMQPRDHTGYKRLVLELDGPAGDYQALMFSGESQAVTPARIAIEAGRVTTIDLDSVGGLDLARLRAVGVFASGAAREVDFTIRQARLE